MMEYWTFILNLANTANQNTDTIFASLSCLPTGSTTPLAQKEKEKPVCSLAKNILQTTYPDDRLLQDALMLSATSLDDVVITDA